ncbi:MAG: Omp28-related outer membrane protein [Candidatus Limimorpha sp.]
MKKLILLFAAMLGCFFVNAQQFVSTEPSNKNVIIEEFTGRNCGYCPDGHAIANQICDNNPGRVWAVNIHTGGFSPTSYPNLNTNAGNVYNAGFSVTSYPAGCVNRSLATSVSRNQWTSITNSQLAQATPVNVDGRAVINKDTREVSITVELYYTDNSAESTNFLTIFMIQDSIMGSQSGGSVYNPAQVINGSYCHMHVLRDVLTATWGDEVSPTTMGTLITKTYNYTVPQSIGAPNGVEVDMNNINFIAFVTEKVQGPATRPVLNVMELDKTYGSNEPINPVVSGMEQVMNASCTQVKTFNFDLLNAGTETLTSVDFEISLGDVTINEKWEGSLASNEQTPLTFDIEVPFGTSNGTVKILKANEIDYEYSTNFVSICDEWIECPTTESTANVKVYINQDQYGEQTTWTLINSVGDVVASGGPYAHLTGQGATQQHVESIKDLPTNECYKFTIYDAQNNGICCNYGEGWYKIKVDGVTIVGEGQDNGNFGASASHHFSILVSDGVESNVESNINIYPNPANELIFIEGENISFVQVYNALGQVVASTPASSDKMAVNVASLEQGVYVVRVVSVDGSVSTKKVSITR